MSTFARFAPIIVTVVVVVAALAWLSMPTIFHAEDRARVYRIENDMRTVAIALESYRMDHGVYPPPAPSKSGWTRLPSLLTTPTAYLSTFPVNPLMPRDEPYGYALLAESPQSWAEVASDLDFSPAYVLLSPGPSREHGPFRLDLPLVYDPTNGAKSPGYVFRFGGDVIMEEDGRLKVGDVIYDPTNETRSGNGVFRVKQ